MLGFLADQLLVGEYSVGSRCWLTDDDGSAVSCVVVAPPNEQTGRCIVRIERDRGAAVLSAAASAAASGGLCTPPRARASSDAISPPSSGELRQVCGA